MSPCPRVAYLCMEFALADDLPQYAGGLGVLAGDILRQAHDDDIPLVGVSLFWSEGYLAQRIAEDGWPRESGELVPRDRLVPTGIEVSVRVRGRDVPLVAHRVRVDRCAPLYVLEPRDEADRPLTRGLYQGGYGDRVAQEILLGVGGVRLLRALGHEVDVIHLNEGHAVFAAIELTREAVARGEDFEDAVAEARRRLVFTTHTPILAGNEAHELDLLLEQGADLGFTRAQVQRFGGSPFSMTEAALRMSRKANAVSKLHAETAKRMWAYVDEMPPFVAITNGVHVPTWQDPRMAAALASADGDPWTPHQELKRELVEVIAARTGTSFRLDAPLVGFARRATGYKRMDLLFREPERLQSLLDAGLQLVFAGKAYPDDGPGKGLIARIVEVSRAHPGRIVYLEQYDLELGRLLTRGCDVWLNMPRRPLEASGTSGMKAALNGVLNLSVLDGWWDEACEHGVNGWQFGDGYEGMGQDEHDLHALLRVLADEVLPTYSWDRATSIAMMRAAASTAVERFSAARMLSEYRTQLWS